MPPPIEKNQKAAGMMLLRARSLAIHWTTKRMKKKAWPRNPMISQIVALSIIPLSPP